MLTEGIRLKFLEVDDGSSSPRRAWPQKAHVAMAKTVASNGSERFRWDARSQMFCALITGCWRSHAE